MIKENIAKGFTVGSSTTLGVIALVNVVLNMLNKQKTLGFTMLIVLVSAMCVGWAVHNLREYFRR